MFVADASLRSSYVFCGLAVCSYPTGRNEARHLGLRKLSDAGNANVRADKGPTSALPRPALALADVS